MDLCLRTHIHTHTRNNKVLLHRMFRHSTHTAAPCLFDGGVDFSRVFYTATHTPHTSAHVHTHTREHRAGGVWNIFRNAHTGRPTPNSRYAYLAKKTGWMVSPLCVGTDGTVEIHIRRDYCCTNIPSHCGARHKGDDDITHPFDLSFQFAVTKPRINHKPHTHIHAQVLFRCCFFRLSQERWLEIPNIPCGWLSRAFWRGTGGYWRTTGKTKCTHARAYRHTPVRLEGRKANEWRMEK